MTTRRIGGSEESVPVIGMGSSNTFDVGDSPAERSPLREVLQIFAAGGGTVVDTSPMYGRAESVLGDLIDELQLRPKFWLATKVWTRGRAEGRATDRDVDAPAAHVDRLELVQIHNLLDWREHVPTLRNLKDERQDPLHGHHALSRRRARRRCCRCSAPSASTGCRSTTRSASARPSRACCRTAPSTASPCSPTGPFADGGLFDRTRGKTVPPWAAEIGCESWAQFFLRFAARTRP